MQEATNSLISESRDYLDKLRKTPSPSAELRQLALRHARELERSINRFDSKLILMATIGSVKSGKSTLSNCLARRDLCATELGIETTRLPLIILASPDGTERLELYSPKATHALDEQELFELVIDHLRGIDGEAFQEKINLDRRPLEAEHLEAWAKGRTQANCAAIFLVEPDARLLQSGIALIDMPGMDGLQSNWHDEKLHAWMNRNADYFLLVQSSFAALTPDTRHYLKQAMEQSPRPIRVVQNRIEAQFWKDSEGLNEDQNRQQNNTKKILGDILKKIIPSSSMNAGLAWWQIDGKREITKDSHLDALESDILNDLSDSEHILAKNSLDHLHKTLEDIDSSLKRQQKKAEDHLSHLHQLENEIKLLMDKSQLRDAIENQNLFEGRLRSKYLADEAKENLNRRLDLILDMNLDGYFPQEYLERKQTGVDLNRILVKVEQDLGELSAEQETHVLAPEKYCELSELEKKKLASCASILQRRDVEDMKNDLTAAIIEAWVNIPLNCDPVELGKLEERKMLGMMGKRYSYQDVVHKWRSEGRHIIAKRLSEWHDLVNEQFNTFITARIDALENCLNLEWARYRKAEQTTQTTLQANQDIAQIEILRAKLSPVLHHARQLRASK